MKLLLSLAVAGGLMAASAANAAINDDAAQAILKKGGCSGCHKLDKAGAGPSIKDIAAKHKGKADEAKLKSAIRDGSKGLYGADSSMPGFAAGKISDADMTSLVQWIMTK